MESVIFSNLRILHILFKVFKATMLDIKLIKANGFTINAF